MVTQELINYVNSELQKGTPKETIRQSLLGKGWKAEDVDQALSGTQVTPPVTTPSTNSTPPVTDQKGPGTLKTILVIFFLLFFYPVGVVLMAVWMKWKVWVKVVVAVGILLISFAILGIMSAVVLVAINPVQQIQKAQQATCTKQCQSNTDPNTCIADCMKQFKKVPTVTP